MSANPSGPRDTKGPTGSTVAPSGELCGDAVLANRMLNFDPKEMSDGNFAASFE
jgi:hypothetical protein